LNPFWRWWPRRRPRAVFTVVRDEAVFLPIWLRYYSRHFRSSEIFVFDHRTSDGSVAAARARFRFQYARVDHPAYNDFPWYTGFVQERQRELLSTHDLVVFAEPDEILWHPSGLRRYLDAFARPSIRTTGWNVWHDRAEEPDLDLRRRVLAQRRYWVRNTEYDKALVTRVPLTYGFGFHVCHECQDVDADLLLLHLHTMDYRIALQKHQRTSTYRDYSAESVSHNLGFQSQLVGPPFDEWFDGLGRGEHRQRIPRHVLSARPV
jgi:hypothetical protein